jgi:hypothetical protein
MNFLLDNFRTCINLIGVTESESRRCHKKLHFNGASPMSMPWKSKDGNPINHRKELLRNDRQPQLPGYLLYF